MLTLVAHVLSRARRPHGVVTFTIGRRMIAQVCVDLRATATVTVATPARTASIVAAYSGDAFDLPSRNRA